MNTAITREYQGKTYVFEWGTKAGTFVQLIDGSKAVWCPKEDRYYWMYFDLEDTEYEVPIKVLEMSENEQEELELQDILEDISDANQRGMYPEVSPYVREILVGRSARREVIFALNRLDESLMKNYAGIVYQASRQVLSLLNDGVELRVAVGMAVGEWIKRYEGGTV